MRVNHCFIPGLLKVATLRPRLLLKDKTAKSSRKVVNYGYFTDLRVFTVLTTAIWIRGQYLLTEASILLTEASINVNFSPGLRLVLTKSDSFDEIPPGLLIIY